MPHLAAMPSYAQLCRNNIVGELANAIDSRVVSQCLCWTSEVAVCDVRILHYGPPMQEAAISWCGREATNQEVWKQETIKVVAYCCPSTRLCAINSMKATKLSYASQRRCSQQSNIMAQVSRDDTYRRSYAEVRGCTGRQASTQPRSPCADIILYRASWKSF